MPWASAVKFLMARKFNVERALMLYQQHEIMRIRQGNCYSLRILPPAILSFLTLPTVDFYFFFLHSSVFDIKSFSLFFTLSTKGSLPNSVLFSFYFFHYFFIFVCEFPFPPGIRVFSILRCPGFVRQFISPFVLTISTES